jgi:hypothetical protein
VQNLLLLAAAEGLATHRTFGTTLVPEAVIDYVARRLGPAYREGELVTMLAIGYPAEAPRPAGKGVRAEWIGCDWCPPVTPEIERAPEIPPPPPTGILRSPASERVAVVDPYRYNRDNLTRLLAAAGYQVGTYDEGRDVLARTSSKPDVSRRLSETT